MKKTLLLLLLIAPSILFAQKPEITDGSAAAIKDAKEVNVVFDFSEWTFFNEKKTEEEYVSKRKKEIAADKGDAEAEKWFNDWKKTKESKIPNFFISNANKYIKGGLDFVSNSKDAKYTVTIKVSWIYPGYFAVAMNQPSKVSATLTFTSNSDPSKSLLVIDADKIRGIVGPFGPAANTNTRIADSFSALGIYVGKLLKKELKKARK